MTETLNSQSLVRQATQREEEYDWSGATELYSQCLHIPSVTDPAEEGEIHERLGYALFRMAMQAERAEEFTSRVKEAIADYQRARELYEEKDQPRARALALRCGAMASYLGFWLSNDPKDKKRVVDEAWEIAKKTLQAFKEAGEPGDYARTYNELSICASLSYLLEWNVERRETLLGEAIQSGERAIQLLSSIRDHAELARSYAIMAIYLSWLGLYFIAPGERKQYSEKAKSYFSKGKEHSERTALLELASATRDEDAHVLLDLTAGSAESINQFEKALRFVEATKDNLLIGSCLDWLSYHPAWRIHEIEDPDERKKLVKRALEFAESAKRHYHVISFISPRGLAYWIESPAEIHYYVAEDENHLPERRPMLNRALNEAMEGLTRAHESGYPDVIGSMHHVTSKILSSLALLETKRDDRKQFLERALEHRLKSRENFRHVGPEQWNTGVHLNYLADIHSQLAELMDDPESKGTDLRKAIAEKESAIDICSKMLSSIPLFEGPHGVWIADRQREHGALLEQLKDLTRGDAELKRASDAYERAAESYKRGETPSWAGECYWKSAEIHDALGEHLTASKGFLLASEHYKLASDKIPALSTLYREYAEYLEAWGHIEKARHYHKREEYGSAQEYYQKAGELHQSSESWAFLAPNYSAWASIEHGEELSRRDHSREALSAFQNAHELFQNTEQSLKQELDKLQSQEELKMVTKLVKATGARQQYCQGRILVEEAKMLDSKGDHSSASERFASSAGIFERLSRQAESETDSRELRTIATLSLAWQQMCKAEAEVSPELYVEASRLFEQAKELTPSEKGKMIALGHSHLCIAMEQGTRLADTGERAFHSKALQHLESAAKYYLKAGFQSASAYADACRSLFDAYVYMGEVSRTEQPEKRVKLYALAGKVLQASVDLFRKAGQEAKVEQVQRLLQNVREKRELELSLVEVLRAPEILSSTSAFTTPSQTFERAVGLESFEHANVQANLIVGQRSVKVGEDVELEIEMVNAGRAPAQLVKVEELIPEGFDLHTKSEAYRVEESHLNMKGRRLDPLKMEEVKLVLRPRVQGRFTLKPRILYLDNLGKYKSHEPDPVEVTVKELGISGWIKGS